jgi:hypothetical protein
LGLALAVVLIGATVVGAELGTVLGAVLVCAPVVGVELVVTEGEEQAVLSNRANKIKNKTPE